MGRRKERKRKRKKRARVLLLLKKPPKIKAERMRMIPIVKRMERVPIQEMR
jgi:hypothetical protein